MVEVLYQFPKTIEPAALDEFLHHNLLPGLKQAAGLHKMQQNQGPLMSAGGPPPYQRVLQASFASLEDLMGYVQSPVGLATQEFLESTGTFILFYEVQAI